MATRPAGPITSQRYCVCELGNRAQLLTLGLPHPFDFIIPYSPSHLTLRNSEVPTASLNGLKIEFVILNVLTYDGNLFGLFFGPGGRGVYAPPKRR
jgi:hypothetical protein